MSGASNILRIPAKASVTGRFHSLLQITYDITGAWFQPWFLGYLLSPTLSGAVVRDPGEHEKYLWGHWKMWMFRIFPRPNESDSLKIGSKRVVIVKTPKRDSDIQADWKSLVSRKHHHIYLFFSCFFKKIKNRICSLSKTFLLWGMGKTDFQMWSVKLVWVFSPTCLIFRLRWPALSLTPTSSRAQPELLCGNVWFVPRAPINPPISLHIHSSQWGRFC